MARHKNPLNEQLSASTAANSIGRWPGGRFVAFLRSVTPTCATTDSTRVRDPTHKDAAIKRRNIHGRHSVATNIQSCHASLQNVLCRLFRSGVTLVLSPPGGAGSSSNQRPRRRAHPDCIDRRQNHSQTICDRPTHWGNRQNQPFLAAALSVTFDTCLLLLKYRL